MTTITESGDALCENPAMLKIQVILFILKATWIGTPPNRPTHEAPQARTP